VAPLFAGAYRKAAFRCGAGNHRRRATFSDNTHRRSHGALARAPCLLLNGQWTAQDDVSLQLSMEAMKVPAAHAAGQPASNASNVRGLHAQTPSCLDTFFAQPSPKIGCTLKTVS
jgi:hypothetical protein